MIEWILIVFVLLSAGFLYLVAPNKGRESRMEIYKGRVIAHRGLHDLNDTVAENSPSAFRLAMEKGYIIEMDVVMTKDKVPVVFHDYDGKRAFGVDKKIEEMDLEELQTYSLFGLGEHVPTFREFLSMIEGKVPLLIEIKGEQNPLEVTAAVAKELEDYAGEYAVQSFNPLIIAWYRKHVPGVLRGLLATDYFKDTVKLPFITKLVLEYELLNVKARPDFLSYNSKFKQNGMFRFFKTFFHVPTAGWTIESLEEFKAGKNVFDVYIFQGFDPKEAE